MSPPLPPDDREIGGTTGPDGVARKYRVTYERLAKTPAWDPGTGKIPLTLEEASRIAQKWLEAQNPQHQAFRPVRFYLSRVEEKEGEQRWVWAIWFSEAPSGRDVRRSDLEVYLLMDGTVVEPTTEQSETGRQKGHEGSVI